MQSNLKRILLASASATIVVGCAYGREVGRNDARSAAATPRCPAERVIVKRDAKKGFMFGGYWVDVCGKTILIRQGPDGWYDVTAKADEYDDNPIRPKEEDKVPPQAPRPSRSPARDTPSSHFQQTAVSPDVDLAAVAARRAKAEEVEAELRAPCGAALKVDCDSSLSVEACKELTSEAEAVFSGKKRNLRSDVPLCSFFPVHSVKLRFSRGGMEFLSNYGDGISRRLCLSEMSFVWTGQENVLYQKEQEAQTCNALPAMGRFMQSAMTFTRTMQSAFLRYLLQDYMNGPLTVHLRGSGGTEIEFGLSGEGLRSGGMISVKSGGRFSTVYDQSFSETFAEARTRTVREMDDVPQKKKQE